MTIYSHTIPPNRLKEQREKSRLTQDEVAAILGLTPTAVSRHEGSSRGLSRDLVAKYAKLYKVNSYELFVNIDDDSPAA